jgi:MoxR-like ATPase
MKESAGEHNFHEIAQKRFDVRKALKDESLTNPTVKSVLENELKSLTEQAKAFSIEGSGGLSKARGQLKSEKQSIESALWIDEKAIAETVGPAYEEITSIEGNLKDLADFEIRRMREAKSNPYAKRGQESLLKTVQSEKAALKEKIAALAKEKPLEYRATELAGYKQGMHSEGHIAPTPSVEHALSEIGMRMITGKPMFLHGPTGTGKTSLGRYAAKHFTGKDAEMVYCNPQTRESNIWGKTGIRPTESGGIETVDIFGPLARAMQKGEVVVFDEFTALPREQMVFIKGVFNAKPGDSVNIVGNGKIEIAPGFQMIFTANLKSDKNPERQELPPEIAREFEQNNLEINYTPKEEAYDIMIARLMNPDGSLDMSWHDLNTTLPKLCEAIEEIQLAYTDKTSADTAKLTGTQNASGKNQGLKKFVMTQGTVEAIFESWQVEKQMASEQSFAEFLDKRLATGLTFKEYPEADRILAAKILASKGLLTTLDAEDLDLPKNVFDFDAARKLRSGKKGTEALRENSAKENHLSIREAAELDPFGLRKKALAESVQQFLAPDAKKPAGEKTERASFDEAREAIGEQNFYGPDEIMNTFGVELTEEQIPEIPFSVEELEKAKALGQELVLYVDQAKDGKPLTVKKMKEVLGNVTSKNQKFIFSDWFETDAVMSKEVPLVGWRLTGKEPLKTSADKNYLQQTEAIVEYLKNEVFADGMPSPYQDAIDEFEAIKDSLVAPTVSQVEAEWKMASEKLAKLKINELCRENFSEAVFRLALHEKKTGERLLDSKGRSIYYTWTCSRGSGGGLVGVGDFDGDGALAPRWEPGYSASKFGVCFSRSE